MSEEREEPTADVGLVDPAGFSGFYRRNERQLIRFFAREVYDPELALDLTAETFAQAFIGRHRFRGKSRAEQAAWLQTIARRQLSRYYRRGRVERKALQRLRVELPRPNRDELERIEELAGLADARAAVRHALSRIGPDQRQALELRVVNELPYPEVARRLGVSEQTARARVSRALRALESGLEFELGGEEPA